MKQFKRICIIVYCCVIGLFLNEKWFKENKYQTNSKQNKILFHASFIGFKIKQISSITIPILTILIIINQYI